jgi:hypothetical protein
MQGGSRNVGAAAGTIGLRSGLTRGTVDVDTFANSLLLVEDMVSNDASFPVLR